MTVIKTFQIDLPFHSNLSIFYCNSISLYVFVFLSIVWSDGIWQLAQSPLLKRLLWSVWEADEGPDYNIGGLFLPVWLSLKYPPPSCQQKTKQKRICPKRNLYTHQPHLLWHLHPSPSPLAAACRMASSYSSGINGLHLTTAGGHFVRRNDKRPQLYLCHSVFPGTITQRMEEERDEQFAASLSVRLGGSEHLCRYG